MDDVNSAREAGNKPIATRIPLKRNLQRTEGGRFRPCKRFKRWYRPEKRSRRAQRKGKQKYQVFWKIGPEKGGKGAGAKRFRGMTSEWNTEDDRRAGPVDREDKTTSE